MVESDLYSFAGRLEYIVIIIGGVQKGNIVS